MVHNISNIVIAGAGIMGSSIAQLFAGHGYRVVLYDINAVSYTHLTLPTTPYVFTILHATFIVIRYG